MAREATVVRRFDFGNGFITEATELLLDGSVTIDESNFTIENDRSRKRRLGVDYETNYNLHLADAWSSGDAVTLFEWRNVGGLGTNNFVVVQIGSKLHFYDIDGDAFSPDKVAGTVDLTSHKETNATDTEVAQTRIRGAGGRSRFFVTGKYVNPFYVEWSGTSISTTSITILERDFEGASDGLDVSIRPTELSKSHNYNLRNQGWTSERINSFESNAGNFPSNADIMHFGFFSDSSVNNRRSWDWRQVRDHDFGTTRAPQGRFVRDIFDTTSGFSVEDANEVSTFSHDGETATVTFNVDHGLIPGQTIFVSDTSFTYVDNDGTAGQTYTYEDETYTVKTTPASNQITFEHNIENFETSDPDASYTSTDTAGTVYAAFTNPGGVTIEERPQAIAFYAGRIWWAGVDHERLSNKLYFNKIIEYEDQIGECFQAADPTAEHINELVDSDGGFITIAEMGQVKAMHPIGDALLVFATNGVWSVLPGEDGFFSARSFLVRKISNVELTTQESIVEAEGLPIFWTYQGIYTLSADEATGLLNIRSLSTQTIQEFYREISDESKERAFGVYDDVDKRVYWLYSSDSANPHKFDKALLFDVRKGAFQKYDFKSISNGPFIAAAAKTLQYDDVDNKIKFFTIIESDGSFTFSNLNETSFHDWKTHDGTGVDANAFLISGYETNEDISRTKQAPVVMFALKRTETGTDSNGDLLNPGSCKMQARWDWSNDANSNKFNPERQIYKIRRTFHAGSHPQSSFDDGFPVVWSRNKVRGRGRALNFKLSSEEDKDVHILGWQIEMVVETNP